MNEIRELPVKALHNIAYVHTMAEAYIEAALFSADEDIVPPRSGQFDASPYLPRVTKASKNRALEVCARFYADNQADLSTYGAAAQVLGEQSVWKGKGGWIHVDNG